MPAPSPLTAMPEGPLNVTISVDGTDKPNLPLISVTVRHALNTISWAKLVVADGDMTKGTMTLGDDTLFKPGTALVVKAGHGDDSTEIFSGVVVRQGLRITGPNDSRLEVECRHTACKATLGRRSAHYSEQTDSAIIESLLGRHGLACDVSATTVTHHALSQHYCSDWDFIVARADAMGQVLHMAGPKIVVEAPKFSAAPVLTVTWGTDLIDLRADIDARTQWTSVQASCWDPSQQDLLQGSSEAPVDGNAHGDLKGAALGELGGLDPLALQSCAPLGKEQLDAWAKATQLKATLARQRGHLSFQGSALAVPGSLITLAGVGKRFGGDVYLCAVQHELTDGAWTTQAEFGRDPDWQVDRRDISAPLNAGLLPGIAGLHIGVVMKLDEDPQGEQRIQVKLPALQAEAPGIWARLLQAHASSGFGHFFVPEIGDEVLLGFLNDDPRHPVVLGSLYSSQRQPPYAPEAKNNTKAIVTRCKHRIEFNEEDKIITVVTPGKNTVVLDDKDKSILLKDENGNSVKLSTTGIALDSPKEITLTAGTKVAIKASTGLTLDCDADIAAAGMNITATAKVGFTGKGSATAELSAAGQTTVKGGLVMIN